MRNCENCGSVFGIHGCTWCNEELYIFDQYVSGGMYTNYQKVGMVSVKWFTQYQSL